MTLELLGPLLLVLTTGLLTPGPDFLVIVRHGLRGSGSATLAALGIACGLAIQTGALALGLGSLEAGDLPLDALHSVGGAVLMILALRILRSSLGKAAASKTQQPQADARRSAFLEGLVCNLTNPKAFLFFASLFAGMKSRMDPLALAAVITAHGLACWLLLGRLLQQARLAAWLNRHERSLQILFGFLLLVLGAGLLWGLRA